MFVEKKVPGLPAGVNGRFGGVVQGTIALFSNHSKNNPQGRKKGWGCKSIGPAKIGCPLGSPHRVGWMKKKTAKKRKVGNPLGGCLDCLGVIYERTKRKAQVV